MLTFAVHRRTIEMAKALREDQHGSLHQHGQMLETRRSSRISTDSWVFRWRRTWVWRSSFPPLEVGRWKIRLHLRSSEALGRSTKKENHPKTGSNGLCSAEPISTAIEHALKTKFEKKFWCNSTTALSWIKSPPAEFKAFLSARVAEIQESHPKDIWQYITSEENPTDVLTRGIKPEELQRWLSRQQESDWPTFGSERATKKASKLQLDPERKTKTKPQEKITVQHTPRSANEPPSKSPWRRSVTPRRTKMKKGWYAALVTEIDKDTKEFEF